VCRARLLARLKPAAVSFSGLLGRVQRVAAWLSFFQKAASNPLAVQAS
jgi:hypothetical protein